MQKAATHRKSPAHLVMRKTPFGSRQVAPSQLKVSALCPSAAADYEHGAEMATENASRHYITEYQLYARQLVCNRLEEMRNPHDPENQTA